MPDTQSTYCLVQRVLVLSLKFLGLLSVEEELTYFKYVEYVFTHCS